MLYIKKQTQLGREFERAKEEAAK